MMRDRSGIRLISALFGAFTGMLIGVLFFGALGHFLYREENYLPLLGILGLPVGALAGWIFSGTAEDRQQFAHRIYLAIKRR